MPPTVRTTATTVFRGFGAGRHAIRFDAEGEFRPLQTQEEIAYRIPAEKFSEDTAMQGDWQDKYGSQGYVLFSYDTAGAHRVKQPDRIRSIVYANYDRMGHVHYADAAGDPRALRSDRRGDGSRSLGAIVTRDPVACWQVMTVDLDARDTRPTAFRSISRTTNGRGAAAPSRFSTFEPKNARTGIHGT